MRGRGRGRGRGTTTTIGNTGSIDPETAKPVNLKPIKEPPPLWPAFENMPVWDQIPYEPLLLKKKMQLQTFSRNSPYYVQPYNQRVIGAPTLFEIMRPSLSLLPLELRGDGKRKLSSNLNKKGKKILKLVELEQKEKELQNEDNKPKEGEEDEEDEETQDQFEDDDDADDYTKNFFDDDDKDDDTDSGEDDAAY
eukprot:TRINITY_DN755_c0_g2_i1.p1 TRINITY_DN755_c0_g2~~TRINITY_DN755_c0_g2_i1.p1  ORF type:complete len:194 (+),score=100.96 TRINITY_DN755_c0_g2_i1:102-683(+)